MAIGYWSGLMRWVAVAVFLVCACCGDVETVAASDDPVTATSSPAVERESEEATEMESSSSGYSRLWHNMWVLFQNTWKDVGWYLVKMTMTGLVAGAGFFVAGCVAGLVVYLWVRRKLLFHAPWGWYRYVRWIWAPLFVALFGLGIGYAGANLAVGHMVKSAIREDRIVDRAVSQLYCAVAFDTAEYKLTGSEKLEEIRAVLDQSEGLARVVSSDLGKLVREVADDRRVRGTLSSGQQQWLDKIVNSKLGGMTLAQLSKEFDPRLVILLFYAVGEGDETSKQFLESHPNARPLAAACTEMFATIRNQLCGLVNTVVYPNAVASVLLGVGIPFGLLGLLRFVVRWTRRKPPLSTAS
jgi:hypothetical protein